MHILAPPRHRTACTWYRTPSSAGRLCRWRRRVLLLLGSAAVQPVTCLRLLLPSHWSGAQLSPPSPPQHRKPVQPARASCCSSQHQPHTSSAVAAALTAAPLHCFLFRWDATTAGLAGNARDVWEPSLVAPPPLNNCFHRASLFALPQGIPSAPLPEACTGTSHAPPPPAHLCARLHHVLPPQCPYSPAQSIAHSTPVSRLPSCLHCYSSFASHRHSTPPCQPSA